MCPNRREVVTGIAGIATGVIGLSALSTESKATTIAVQSLDVPNNTSEVSSPVTSAQLAVNGEYSVNAEVVPTRVILRLEAKRATSESYTQLDAEEPGQTLNKQFTEPFEFKANLLDLERVNAPLLTPSEVGDTTQVDLDIRLKLVVKKDGRTLKEVTTEDTATLTVEKTTAGASVGIEAQGNITVSD